MQERVLYRIHKGVIYADCRQLAEGLGQQNKIQDGAESRGARWTDWWRKGQMQGWAPGNAGAVNITGV